MFSPLPAETVFEARRRSQRQTWLLFGLLVAAYVLVFNAMACTAFAYFHWSSRLSLIQTLAPGREQAPWMLAATLSGALAAAFHFLRARSLTLPELLKRLDARPADPEDEQHAAFIRVVSEAESISGLQSLQPVILASAGRNAFCMQDAQGHAALGVTEGLLGNLSRSELSAVVAHETAHLIHGDSRLVTTACALFSALAGLQALLRSGMNSGPSRRRDGRLQGLLFVLWVIAACGYGLTRLISMAISRQREYLADADAVRMSKDPLALSLALQKISQRPYSSAADAYSALFIAGPESSLFSDHPPLTERRARLMQWAKGSLPILSDPVEASLPASGSSASSNDSARPQAAASPGFLFFDDSKWQGPYSPPQLLALGKLNPQSWVTQAGSQEVLAASAVPELLPLFKGQMQGVLTKHHCPRCQLPLLQARYEGAELEECSFCKGRLLKDSVLERILSREFEKFSPSQVADASTWRDHQRGPLKDRSTQPEIHCPVCTEPMYERIHSLLTQVVLDRCSNEKCNALWCDGGELETMQMLMEAGRTETKAANS